MKYYITRKVNGHVCLLEVTILPLFFSLDFSIVFWNCSKIVVFFCNNVNKLLIYLTTILLVGCLSGQYCFYLTTILLVGCLSGQYWFYLTTILFVGCLSGQYCFYLTTILLVGCLSGQYCFYLTTILLLGCLSG
jgi:hypothetical protein